MKQIPKEVMYVILKNIKQSSHVFIMWMDAFENKDACTILWGKMK